MKTEKHPSVLRYCVTCQQDTPHELRICECAFVRICARCLERVLRQTDLAGRSVCSPGLGYPFDRDALDNDEVKVGGTAPAGETDIASVLWIEGDAIWAWRDSKEGD